MTFEQANDWIAKDKSKGSTAFCVSEDGSELYVAEHAPFSVPQAPPIVMTSAWDIKTMTLLKNHHDGKHLSWWFVMYHTTPEMLMYLSIAYNSVHNPEFKASQEELDALMSNFDASWKEAWGNDEKALLGGDDERVTDMCRPFREGETK